MRPGPAVLLLTALCTGPIRADAQESQPATREESLGRERDRKATEMEPPEPGAVERWMLRLEDGRAFERIVNPPQGFYPKVGSVTAGSGMSFGAGYRHMFSDTVSWGAFGFGSFRKYWAFETRFVANELGGTPLFIDLHAHRSDYPDEDYFGQGAGAQRIDHVSYGIKQTTAGATTGWRFRPWLATGARFDWLDPHVRPGPGTRVPPINRVFPPDSVPGLPEQPDYLNTDLFIEANTREPLNNPRAGGRYRLTFQRYADLDGGAYSFNRIEADGQQYIPLLTNRRIIALHGLVSSSQPDDGSTVPFYMARTLGGPDDLRGFRRYRFRDRSLVLFQAEYRFEIFPAVDGALFYDTGRVAERLSDIDVLHMESDYGIGVRFGTINGVFLRIEGAFGSRDGKHFVIRLAHVF
jgi:hypothetical protein